MASKFAASPGAADESITNNQEAGVDEGGIVKAHGDHLIVLRRGRLFSVRVGVDEVVPVSRIDATPPGGSRDTWYDEMLIHGDTIIVVGFSYGASATELGMFEIDDRGQLRHRSTYYMRSNDYYSSRNYAGRVVGDTLVFYMPYYFDRGEERSLPAIRAYDADRGRWTQIVRTIHHSVPNTPSSSTLHTVVRCDLKRGAGQLACDASGILGESGRTFYVSPSAVYVWVTASREATVYRLPLDGTRPVAVRAAGAPIDQFSFKESGDHLDVLVRAEGSGDAMWGPEHGRGAVALVRIPLASFAIVPPAIPATAYRVLPDPGGYTAQNRFVGDHVLYGAGNGWGYADKPTAMVYVASVAGDGERAPTAIELPHGVDRIEAMGRDAVVIGSDGKNLHFTSIRLADEPVIVDDHVQPGASQGELRSHGFFYKPDDDPGDGGMLGLPVRGSGGPGWEHLARGSAAVLFLDVDALRFRPLGGLFASTGEVDDRCVASCVDWYGNARPIFYRRRIFALLGYELVEGRVQRDQIHTVRRTNFLYPLPKPANTTASKRAVSARAM